MRQADNVLAMPPRFAPQDKQPVRRFLSRRLSDPGWVKGIDEMRPEYVDADKPLGGEGL